VKCNVELNLVGMEGKSNQNQTNMLHIPDTSKFLELHTYMFIESSADLGEVVLQQDQNKNQYYSGSWTCAYLVAWSGLQAEEEMDCIQK
jgi:hypothetical protein